MQITCSVRLPAARSHSESRIVALDRLKPITCDRRKVMDEERYIVGSLSGGGNANNVRRCTSIGEQAIKRAGYMTHLCARRVSR